MSDMDEVDQPALLAIERIPGVGIVFAKTVPQCHTCMCDPDMRAFIEHQYTIGRRASEIISLLEVREGEGCAVSAQSIDRHMTRGHCTTPQSLREMPKWIKAYDAGLDPHDYEEATNTSVALVKMLVAKIREDILAGDFAIDSKDALAVIRMNYEYEQTSGIKTDYGANEIYIAVSVFMAHVQAVLARFCPMDQQDALDYFHRLLDADPIIKALIEQSREYDGKID